MRLQSHAMVVGVHRSGNSGEGVLERPTDEASLPLAPVPNPSTQSMGFHSLRTHRSEHGRNFLRAAYRADVQSAGADGFWDTNNANLRLSSGASMATPHASGAAAVIQQLYEDGWIVPSYASLVPTNLSDLQPAWAERHAVDSMLLGDGFTPQVR